MSHEVSTKHMIVEYDIKDASFDHAFGCEIRTGFEITKIHVYIPAIDDWLDVTHMSEFDKAAIKLVENEMEYV